jgi:NAD-dependent dihydropyrimidine dehydrogenase PreA subunit
MTDPRRPPLDPLVAAHDRGWSEGYIAGRDAARQPADPGELRATSQGDQWFVTIDGQEGRGPSIAAAALEAAERAMGIAFRQTGQRRLAADPGELNVDRLHRAAMNGGMDQLARALYNLPGKTTLVREYAALAATPTEDQPVWGQNPNNGNHGRAARSADPGDAVTVISREKPHNHNPDDCHECYALTRARPADPGGLRAAIADVRNPYRQGDLHNYGWNDAVTACLRAYDAALATTGQPERYAARPADPGRLREALLDLTDRLRVTHGRQRRTYRRPDGCVTCHVDYPCPVTQLLDRLAALAAATEGADHG